jgi:hypothetical protein
MDPKEEAQSLRKNPLPETDLPQEDMALLPTQIHNIDVEILKLQAQQNDYLADMGAKIQALRARKEKKIELALKEGILDDGVYRLKEEAVLPKLKVDATLFRNTCPKEYLKIIKLRAENIQDEADALLLLETVPDPVTGDIKLRPLGKGDAAPSSFSKDDLKIVFKGKGSPEKILSLQHRPGETLTFITVVKKEAENVSG